MTAAPFSPRAKGLVLERLPDGYGFGFDYNRPAGVKLIPPTLFENVDRLHGALRTAEDSAAFGVAFPDLFRNPREGVVGKRLSVWLHVVNACNFRCHFCYVPHLRRAVDPREIERHSAKQAAFEPLLDNLLTYCRSQGLEELHVIFAGGEPTLNLPLVEGFCHRAVALAGETKITFGMISNGSFQANALIPILRRHHISLSLSADGFEESHDRIRFELNQGKRTGSWKVLLRNVDELQESDIAPYFLFTVTPENFRDIAKFAGYAHSRGLGFRLSLVRTKQLVSAEVQAAVAAELCRFYEEIAEKLDPALPIPRYAAFAEWDLYRKKYSPCSSCRNYFAVDADNNVATCQMKMDTTYGNAATEPFNEIVGRIQNSAATQVLTKPMSRRGACVDCEYFHVCAGGCPQHTQMALGSADQPSPWCSVFGTVIPCYVRAVARQLQRAVLSAPR